jgi:osmotically-inducible protein OsmY
MATMISITEHDQALIDDVLCRFDHDPRIDASQIDVDCESGHVTLTGSVAWTYQKLAAEFDARSVPGVRAVHNRIVVQSAVSPSDVTDRIIGAARSFADTSCCNVRVDVSGRVVTLVGTVNSWVGKQLAERAAWRTPGVAAVRNRIEVTS